MYMKKHLLLLMTLLGAAQTGNAQEIYAALDYTQQATIYYDDQKDARYGENMGFGNLYGTFNYVTTVVFDASVKNYHPRSLATWFQNWVSLRTFEHLDYLNTENVETMQGMFHNCSSLESLNLSSFNTPNLTNMEGMFAYCTELRSVNLSSFDTSEVTDMGGLFAECTSLTGVNISSFNTAKVTNMSSMFYNCKSLQEIDVSHFKTTALTNMSSMFENCSELDNLDLSSANTSAVTDMSHLFYNCESLYFIYADEVKWSTAAVTESTDMFKNCYSLCGHGSESRYGTCYEYVKVNDATYARVDGPNRAGYLTQKNGPSGGEPEPYAVLLGGNTRLVFCYDGNKESRGGLDIGPFTAESTRWGGHAADIMEVGFQEDFANARPTSTAYWFKGMTNLGNIQGLSYLNTSEVTDMSYMFANTQFYELDLSSLNTAKVTSMKGMFSDCSLSEFNGSKFNTQNVTDMSYMFADSKIDYCNFRSFNTENVTDMSNMFRNMYNLYNLDLIYFNTSRVTNMEEMFYGCYSLRTIYVDEDSWSTASVTTSTKMFYDCSSLEGSKGTQYDYEHYDAEYARVDKAGQPGYLSVKDPSAYAALSNENTVLTFYYDNKKDKRGGMNIGPFRDYDKPSWYSHRETIKELIFDGSFAQYKSLNSTRNWFWNCNITSITGIENLNTDKVTDMHQMFYNCSVLESIDLSHFSTASAIDMSSMFSSCDALRSLDVNGFDTSKVTDMSSMFSWCTSLTSLDLNSFKIDKVKNMNYMFSNCTALQTIYSDNTWTCSQSKNMFKECTSLKGAIEYDASKIDVTYANPETGYFTPKTTPAEPEPYAVYDNGTLTFYYDGKKTERGGYDVGPFESSSTRWGGYKSEINNIIFDDSFAKCTTLTSTAHWFEDFLGSESISFTGLNNLKTDNVTDMSYMFYSCKAKNIDVSGFNTEKVTTMEKMFDDCDAMVLDVSNFKTDNVTSMRSMFESCNYLTSLDLSNFNTENVTDMSSMFYGDGGLENLNISGFKTGNVTTMNSMFAYCSKLEQIDVSHFETSNVQNMLQMFCGCKSLTSIDVSNFNTENVYVMSSMFTGCSALTQIDVSHFNTSQVSYMNSLFENCMGITSIDVSNFNIARVQEMKSMFSGCSALKTIYSDATWFCSYSPDMFKDCTSLVGGAGTTYDADHIDVNYARIDGGTDAPGYFTSVSDMPKICAKPVISVVDGKIVFDSTTEGVTYKSSISKSFTGSSANLKDTYTLSVYAVKDGYEDSEAVTVEIQLDSLGKKGDVDGNGVVEIDDAERIVNYVVGKVDMLAPRHEANQSKPE